MTSYKFISADSHVQEPESLYNERVPVEYRHRTPRVEDRNGATYLVREGKKDRRLDLAASRTTEDDHGPGVSPGRVRGPGLIDSGFQTRRETE